MLSSRNFASATAALAALKSVKICPKQLSEFWELVGSTGNHWAYRIEYRKGPGLPCPTSHVRELKRQPQAALAQILKFKSYLALRDRSSSLGVENAEEQVLAGFQTSDRTCLICRQERSEYNGLRLKCIYVCSKCRK